jgi:hypothetical protein
MVGEVIPGVRLGMGKLEGKNIPDLSKRKLKL